MIDFFKKNNIYQIKIDTGIYGVGIKDICFQVYDIKNANTHFPKVYAKFALTYNIVALNNDIHLIAEHIPLSEIILFYLDFQISNSLLPGIKSDYHYVKYGTVNDSPIMIILCPEMDGTFSYIKLSEKEGTYKKFVRLSSFDELQDIVRKEYRRELPVRLDAVNHSRLYETLIPKMSSDVANAVEENGYLYYSQVSSLINKKVIAFDNDIRTVIRYGIKKGLFRLEPNMYGYIILTKV